MLLESAPPPAVATWRRALEEYGYPALVRAVLDHEIAASGTACTKDRRQAAWMLAFLGEADRMLACLDEALRLKRAVYDVRLSPAYDPYRDDPRFVALLDRMHLPD